MQNGTGAEYTLFVNYPSGNGPVQHNLLAGIISVDLQGIKNETGLNLRLESSALAPHAPHENSEQTSNAIVIIISGVEASQVYLFQFFFIFKSFII